MSLEIATYISLAILAVFGGATWFLIPRGAEINQQRNLAWSKYVSKIAKLELDFYTQLNSTYSLPDTNIPFSSLSRYDSVLNEIASDYIETRDKLFLRRDQINDAAKAMNLMKQFQVCNVVFYILIMVLYLCFYQKLSKVWWICFLVWFLPWIILLILNRRQSRLMQVYDEESPG